MAALKTNPKIVEVWQIVILFANITALAICGFLWFNFLYEPWPLSWNPLYDILFTRTGGPLLYANHVSSALFILGPASYFALRNPKHALSFILIIMSGVSIHELLLNLVSYPLFQYMHPLEIPTMLNSLDINLRWFFWLTMILAFAVVLADSKQRSKMVSLSIVCCAMFLIWTVVFLGILQINPFTIVQYEAGPAFFDIIPNTFEVLSWFITGAWWLLPDRVTIWSLKK